MSYHFLWNFRKEQISSVTVGDSDELNEKSMFKHTVYLVQIDDS